MLEYNLVYVSFLQFIMRLNDKHLCAFANGTAPVDKEGYLSKRGETNRAFQKRWFVLKGNLLFYYEKKGDKEPIGVIILEGCTVELSESSDAFSFELVFQGSGSRTYVLAAETQNEMEDWMKAIACAGYDFMKLMVLELQRQLDDLTTNRTPETSAINQTQLTTSASGKGTEGLLVDLSVPEQESRRQHPGRRNPFNAEPRSDALTSSCQGSRTRTFIEMHHQFGAYINKKLAEAQSSIGLLD